MTPEEKRKAREEGKTIGEVVADKLKDSLGVDRKTTGAKNIVSEGFSASNVFGQDSMPGKVLDPTEEQKNKLGDTVKDRFASESIGRIKDSLGVRRETEGFGNIMKEGFSAANVFGADSFLAKVFSTDEQRDVAREYAQENKKDEAKPDGTASSASLSKVHDVLVEIKEELQESGKSGDSDKKKRKSGDSEKKNLTDNKKILALLTTQNNFAKKTAETTARTAENTNKIQQQGKKTISLLETMLARMGSGGGGGGGGMFPVAPVPGGGGGGFLSSAKNFFSKGKGLFAPAATVATVGLDLYDQYNSKEEADAALEAGEITPEDHELIVKDIESTTTGRLVGTGLGYAAGVVATSALAAAGAPVLAAGAIGLGIGYGLYKTGEAIGDAFVTTSEEAALEAAEESGLYNKNMIGDSEVNPEILAQTTDPAQLEAILADDDLSDESKQMVQARLQEIGGSEGNTSNIDGSEGNTSNSESGGRTVEVQSSTSMKETHKESGTGVFNKGKMSPEQKQLYNEELSNRKQQYRDKWQERYGEKEMPKHILGIADKQAERDFHKEIYKTGSVFGSQADLLEQGVISNLTGSYKTGKVDSTYEIDGEEVSREEYQAKKDQMSGRGQGNDWKNKTGFDVWLKDGSTVTVNSDEEIAELERKGLADADEIALAKEQVRLENTDPSEMVVDEETPESESKPMDPRVAAMYAKREEKAERDAKVQEMAERMGIDPENVRGNNIQAGVVTEINGQSTEEFLTPEEKETLRPFREANADMQAKRAEMNIPDAPVQSSVDSSTANNSMRNASSSSVESATERASSATNNAPVIVNNSTPPAPPQPAPAVNVVVSMPKWIGPQDASGLRFISNVEF